MSPHMTVHERSVLPSAVKVPFWQPETCVAFGDQDHWRVTLEPVYQRSQPSCVVAVSQAWPTDCAWTTGERASRAAMTAMASNGRCPGWGPGEIRAREYVTYPPWVSAWATWASSYPVAARLWLRSPYPSAAIIRPFGVGGSFCMLLATCLAPSAPTAPSAQRIKLEGAVGSLFQHQFVSFGAVRRRRVRESPARARLRSPRAPAAPEAPTARQNRQHLEPAGRILHHARERRAHETAQVAHGRDQSDAAAAVPLRKAVGGAQKAGTAERMPTAAGVIATTQRSGDCA
jgi:hypothetical protein